ncbi:unnamed protein product [Adineta ricciae]|uniref:G-protein coupled receptors family 1 profile domain-containing protein n=1 Tax=Adineta ricciae TaxID=249248 RepID=A0A814NZR3_ADIRI|nr:unnamed protein product [Adineta ricciae]CAF1100779.1 unnamed protein product [Adineta ricciae]
MAIEYEDSSSVPEKLALLVLIAAIVIGNVCVFVTYIVRSDGKHWSNMFVLGMAFVDLFIGSFVLPMRFISAYDKPLTSRLCAALTIGESCSIACIIYNILFMIFVRLYNLKKAFQPIRRRYIIILLLTIWLSLFVFYGIPFMINSSSYLLTVTSSTTNQTSFCTTYATSIHHPLWMSYAEIGLIFSFPLLCIFLGNTFLIRHLCQRRPRRLDSIDRREYLVAKKMTWHVLSLSLAFLCLCLPWISIRILIIFVNTKTIQRTLQITYYFLIVKCVVFPILYAATNASFRGSFAMYRHKRITTNNRVWTVHAYFR